MINPKELRIGNLVWETRIVDPSPEDLQSITVGAINGIYNTVYDNEDNIYGPEDIYPIPLTPEWLQRMDLVKESYLHRPVYKISQTDYYLRWEDDVVDVSIEDLNGHKHYFRYALKYVHQLQNLYFSLTGKELAIKEKTA